MANRDDWLEFVKYLTAPLALRSPRALTHLPLKLTCDVGPVVILLLWMWKPRGSEASESPPSNTYQGQDSKATMYTLLSDDVLVSGTVDSL